MKIGASPFVLVVESLNQKTGVRVYLVSSAPYLFMIFSLAPNSALGCLNVNSRPSMVTWVRTRRVVVVSPNKFPTKVLILNVRVQ